MRGLLVEAWVVAGLADVAGDFNDQRKLQKDRFDLFHFYHYFDLSKYFHT